MPPYAPTLLALTVAAVACTPVHDSPPPPEPEAEVEAEAAAVALAPAAPSPTDPEGPDLEGSNLRPNDPDAELRGPPISAALASYRRTAEAEAIVDWRAGVSESLSCLDGRRDATRAEAESHGGEVYDGYRVPHQIHELVVVSASDREVRLRDYGERDGSLYVDDVVLTRGGDQWLVTAIAAKGKACGKAPEVSASAEITRCRERARRKITKLYAGTCGRPGHYGNACAIEEEKISERMQTCVAAAQIRDVVPCSMKDGGLRCDALAVPPHRGLRLRLHAPDSEPDAIGYATVEKIEPVEGDASHFEVELSTTAPPSTTGPLFAVWSDVAVTMQPSHEVDPDALPSRVREPEAKCGDFEAYVLVPSDELDFGVPALIWGRCDDALTITRGHGYTGSYAEDTPRQTWAGPQPR